MTIERHAGKMEPVCDECGTGLAKATGHKLWDNDEFDEMIQFMSHEGWSFEKDKAGQWTHTCSECI